MLQAKTIIQEWLSQVGLELKPEKTRIAHTLKEYEGNKLGFDFLGFTVRQWEVKSTRLGFKTLDISKKDFLTTQGFLLSYHNELQQYSQ